MLSNTSSFTTFKSITSLRQSQAFSKNDEHDVDIIPCGADEPICVDNGTDVENPFFFMLQFSLK